MFSASGFMCLSCTKQYVYIEWTVFFYKRSQRSCCTFHVSWRPLEDRPLLTLRVFSFLDGQASIGHISDNNRCARQDCYPLGYFLGHCHHSVLSTNWHVTKFLDWRIFVKVVTFTWNILQVQVRSSADSNWADLLFIFRSSVSKGHRSQYCPIIR